MKKILLLIFVLSLVIGKSQIDSLEGFNYSHAYEHTNHLKTQQEKDELMDGIKSF